MVGGVFSVVKTDRQMSDGLLEPAGAAEGLIVPTVGITMSLSARHEKAGGKGHWHWGPVAGPLPPGPWFWVFPTYPCTMWQAPHGACHIVQGYAKSLFFVLRRVLQP